MQDCWLVWLVEAAAGMSSAGSSGRAELECSVLEEDWQTGQSYTAHWHSLAFGPQHHCRPTAMEAECSGKHWEARMILQRFLSGAISRNYPHLKTLWTRRPQQPVYDPSAAGPKVLQGPECCATNRPSIVLETRERKIVVKMAKMPRFLG